MKILRFDKVNTPDTIFFGVGAYFFAIETPLPLKSLYWIKAYLSLKAYFSLCHLASLGIPMTKKWAIKPGKPIDFNFSLTNDCILAAESISGLSNTPLL